MYMDKVKEVMKKDERLVVIAFSTGLTWSFHKEDGRGVLFSCFANSRGIPGGTMIKTNKKKDERDEATFINWNHVMNMKVYGFSEKEMFAILKDVDEYEKGMSGENQFYHDLRDEKSVDKFLNDLLKGNHLNVDEDDVKKF